MSRANFSLEPQGIGEYAILSFMEDKLSVWLNEQIRERGWSIRETSRRAGLSHTAINNALDGQPVRLDTYRGIARAFGMRLETVLQAAGELPQQLPEVANEQEVIRLFREMPGEHRELALRVLKAFVDAPPQSGSVPKEWTDLAPGESVVLRSWGADHPLLRVLERLQGQTEADVLEWILGLIVQSETSAREREREREREGKRLSDKRGDTVGGMFPGGGTPM